MYLMNECGQNLRHSLEIKFCFILSVDVVAHQLDSVGIQRGLQTCRIRDNGTRCIKDQGTLDIDAESSWAEAAACTQWHKESSQVVFQVKYHPSPIIKYIILPL